MEDVRSPVSLLEYGSPHFNYNAIMDIPFLSDESAIRGGSYKESGYKYDPTENGASGYSADNLTNWTNIWESGVLDARSGDGVAMEWVRDIALGLVLSVLSLLTFVGNAMVLHAVRTERRLQTVSNMFIVSLGIADLIVGLIVMPISSIYIFTVDWPFGVGLCQFWIGVDYTASTASILNLFILSLDRYWSVTSPLKYLRQRTKRRALKMISLVWFASSLWLIPIIGWHYFEHDGVRSVPNDVCDTEYATNNALKIVTGLLNFYLPLAIMYALYSKIFIEIKRRSKMEFGQRIAGGASYETCASVSDDSDEKQFTDSIPLKHKVSGSSPQNGKASFGRTISQVSTTSGMRTDLDTDTDQTDDDVARLHKSGYTNMTLVRVSGDKSLQNSSDAYSSDSDYNRVYVYDESVIDSTTEKIHRYYHTHQRDGNPEDRCIQNGKDVHNGSTEGPKTSRDGSSRVRFQIDQYDRDKTPVLLPKETHPAKNTYVVKPRCYQNPKLTLDSDTDTSPKFTRNTSSSLSEVQRKHSRGPKNPPHRLTNGSALVKQAMRWRLKLDKKRHKHSSALSKEIKAARQLGVIMGAFTVCFLPYFVCFMVVAFCDKCVGPGLMTAVTWIGYLNSTLNPFLYPLCNAHFRRKFREMLRLTNAIDRRRNSVYYHPSRNFSTTAGCEM